MPIVGMKKFYVYTWKRYEISILGKDIHFLYYLLYIFNAIYEHSMHNCFYSKNFISYVHVP